MNVANQPKILLVITRLDAGGSSDAVLNLAVGLRTKRCDVKVVYGRTSNPGMDLLEFQKVNSIELIEIGELQREINPLKDWIALLKLFLLIRREGPDVVHTHSSKAGILGRAAAWFAGVSVIIHSPHGHIFYGYFNTVWTRLFVLLEKIIAPVTNRIATLTEFGKRDHVELEIASANKFVTIPCGIDLKRFKAGRESARALRRELGISDDEKVVGWVGRLEPIKGCRYFIRACELVADQNRDVRFVISGDGTLGTELQSYAESTGLQDRMLFLGQRKDIPVVMKAFDVFVLSSLNEGLGRVLVEAMASAVPIVATRVGGVPEVLDYGRAGLLVSPKDTGQMAAAILKLVGDRRLAMKLTGQAKRMSRMFTVEKMVDKTFELYTKELGVDYELAAA